MYVILFFAILFLMLTLHSSLYACYRYFLMFMVMQMFMFIFIIFIVICILILFLSLLETDCFWYFCLAIITVVVIVVAFFIRSLVPKVWRQFFCGHKYLLGEGSVPILFRCREPNVFDA